MISKEHRKHADLLRPAYGNFHRNEWSLIGSQCNTIKSLADNVISQLESWFKCAYVDAHHASENENLILPEHLKNGATISYTNYLTYHQFNDIKEFNQFDYRQAFNHVDIVLVNGNHFEAKSQVLIIEESKRASLEKRVSQLTNVEMILLEENVTDVFDFVKEALPIWKQLPIYKLNETDKIADFFKTKLAGKKPPLMGLVLAGGKSVRMGTDKGLIAWHGKEQRYYIADILKEICSETFISCRPDQQQEIDVPYQTIADTFTDLGPYGAILSAFRHNPDAAWLVVACDLPLLDLKTLEDLKANRNQSAMATSFESPYNHFPEPLITIWEPKSYPVLLTLLSQGYNCPGKALRNMDTNMIKSTRPEALTNVNTQEDFEKVKQAMKNKLQESHAG